MKTSTLPLTLLASYAMGVIGTPIAAEERSVNMTALFFDTPDQVSNIQKTVSCHSESGCVRIRRSRWFNCRSDRRDPQEHLGERLQLR